jgi:tetratricopeptide (TPR) repeat protein
MSATVPAEQLIRFERRVLARSQSVWGSESRVTAGARSWLTESLDHRQESSDALVIHGEEPDTDRRSRPESIDSELQLAGMFAAANQLRKAKKHLAHVIDETRLRPDVDLSLTLAAMYRLGRLYLDEGKPRKAQEMLEPALMGYRARFGEDHVETRRAARALAIALGRQEKFDGAIAILRQLLLLEGSGDAFDDPEMVASRWLLAEWLHAVGQYPEAEMLAVGVLASKVRVLGYDHPESTAVRSLLAKIFRASTKR